MRTIILKENAIDCELTLEDNQYTKERFPEKVPIITSQGKKIEEHLLPVSRPTSCCFAGDDYSTLVVTTASQDIDRISEPLAGKVLVLTGTGLSGLPSYKYG